MSNQTFKIMKQSEKNRCVIENFILHVTHSSEGDAHYDEELILTPRDIYNEVDGYIAEDHVDGVPADDNQVKYRIESSFVSEDKFKVYPESILVVADGGEYGTKTVGGFSPDQIKDLTELIKFINDPKF